MKNTFKKENKMYTTTNFKTKKALKEAVKDWNDSPLSVLGTMVSDHANPQPVTYYQPGPFGGNEPSDGTVFIEGPHFPEPHKFYAECTVQNGQIIKVK